MRRAVALMPTLISIRVILGGLIVATAMEEPPYLWAFTDATELGGPCKSKLVMSRGKRFESARRLSLFGLSKRNIRT